jgi:hypothetical protein
VSFADDLAARIVALVFPAEPAPEPPTPAPPEQPAFEPPPAPPVHPFAVNDVEISYALWLSRQARAERERKLRDPGSLTPRLQQRRKTQRGPNAHLKGLPWFRANARLGGIARAAKLSPERRSEISRHAAQVRWSRFKP